MELRLKRERPNVDEGVPLSNDVTREHPKVAEPATRPPHQTVYWLDAGRPMPYKLGRTEKQILSKYYIE